MSGFRVLMGYMCNNGNTRTVIEYDLRPLAYDRKKFHYFLKKKFFIIQSNSERL